MSLSPSGRPVLLHIVPTAAADLPDSKAIAQWCEDAGLCVEQCPHVYLALPRILHNRNAASRQNHADPIVGVVVLADELSPSELEFFTLVERNRRDVPVFAYGPRSAEKVVQALQAGARALATREAILGLSSKLPETQDSIEPKGPPPATLAASEPASQPEPAKSTAARGAQPPQSSPPPEIKQPEQTPPSIAAPAAVTPPEPLSLEDADESAEEGPAAAVRVPWLRYNGGPERTAPIQRTRPNSTDEVPAADDDRVELFSSPCSMSDVYEPLLTEQELAALLGDEIGDGTAAERDMLAGDGEKPGGKSR